MTLRPYQQQLKQGVYDGWNAGRRNMLAVLPTGAGKTHVVADIVYDKNMLGAQSCVIAHRRELVSQMSIHIAERGVKHRIIGPSKVISSIVAKHRKKFGQSFISPTAHCSVAGVDTLMARHEDLKQWAHQQDLWVTDEAHHVVGGASPNKWGRAVAMFPNALGLGVTATPQRADGLGLGRHADGVFDDMIIGPSSRELMDLGAITDYEYVVPLTDFSIDDDAITDSGDFSPKKMREASKKSRIVGDVVKEYVARTFGKRAIVFATDVETANDIARRFNEVGIPAASVSADTPDDTRDDAVERFKDGRIWVLINVDLFGEGFDCPSCEVVFLCRPTASLAVFLQQCGRSLRVMLGKLYGLIVDMVSNYKRHGFPDKLRFWTLDRREKRGKRAPDPEEIALTACRNCSRPYEACLPRCPHCNAVPEVMPGGRGSIEQIDGDLILLDRAKLAELRAAAELASPADVGQRVTHVAGAIAGKGAINNQIEKIQSQQRLKDSIAMWAGLQRSKGRGDQESYRRFYMTLGVDVLGALALPRADMEKLATQIEGWLA